MFPHEIWNQPEATLASLPHSFNIAEGWHNGFRSLLSCTNPTIRKSLDALKLEQALTDVKLTKHLMREQPEPQKPKWIKYDERLNRVIEDYDNYNILDFLKVTGHIC